MRAQRAGRRVLSRGPATAAWVASPRASESKFELSRRPRRESSLRARQASTHRSLCARGPKPSSRPAAATQDLVTSPAPLIRFFEAGGLVSRGWQLSYSLDHDSRRSRRTRTLLAAMRAAPQERRRPRFADAPALCTGVALQRVSPFRALGNLTHCSYRPARGEIWPIATTFNACAVHSAAHACARQKRVFTHASLGFSEDACARAAEMARHRRQSIRGHG